MYIFLITI